MLNSHGNILTIFNIAWRNNEKILKSFLNNEPQDIVEAEDLNESEVDFIQLMQQNKHIKNFSR